MLQQRRGDVATFETSAIVEEKLDDHSFAASGHRQCGMRRSEGSDDLDIEHKCSGLNCGLCVRISKRYTLIAAAKMLAVRVAPKALHVGRYHLSSIFVYSAKKISVIMGTPPPE